MSIPGSALALLGSGAGAADYTIERSLRFNSADNAYLSKDFSSEGNRKTFTFSCWIKRCSSDGNSQYIFVGSNVSGVTRDDNTFAVLRFNSSDQLEFASESTSYRKTNAVFRDFSAWMHIVLAVDTTNSTANDKIKLYVNGVKIESDQFASLTNPTDDHLFGINQSNVHTIGVRVRGETLYQHYQDAYLGDVHFVGEALAASDFGEYDANGVWQPKEFTPSTEYSTSAITGVTALNTSFTTDAGTANAFGSGNIDEGTYDRKTNGGVLDVTLSPAQSGNFVVYTGAINETSNYTIVFEYSDGTTQTVLNNSTSTRNGPGNTCTVNVGQKSNVVGFTVDCQDSNDSQLCGVTVDGTRLVTGQAYGKQVTLTDGTNLDEFPVDTVVGNGDKVIARDTTNNTLSLDGTSWAAGQYVTKGGYGTNGFHLDFSDNSSNAALGYDAAGSNNWNVYGIHATAPLNSGPFSASNAYTGTTSNSYGSTDGSWNSAFDGGTSNGVYHINQSGETILTMVNSASWSSQIRIRRQLMGGNTDGYVKLNNTEISGGGSASQWIDVTNDMGSSGTLTSVGVKDSHRLFAIELDGEVLTDSASAARVDSLLDSPTNYEANSGNNGGNYATWNALTGNTTLSNGNLDSTGKSGHNQCLSTIGMSSGKYYCEINVTDDTGYTGIGIATKAADGSFLGNTSVGYLYYSSNGNKRTSGTNASYGNSYTTGDTIGIAFDADGGNLYFYKNGAIQNSGTAAFTGLTSGPYFFAVDQYGTSNVITGNFGQRPFAISSVPTGYKALCTQNLLDPLIADGSNYFDTKTWDGNNSSTNSTPRDVDTYKFSPDLVWIKNKNSTEPHNIYDTVRGEGKYLYPHDVNQENDAGSYGLTGFLSNGFSLLDQGPGYWSVNADTRTYVGWAWDAGANSSKTFTVKVVSDSGNKYRFDGHGTSAVTLDLEEGSTYVFDASDSSVDGHPFVLGTAANSGEYSTGVTYTLDGVTKTYSQYTTVSDFNAATTRKLTITVPSGAPTLYYWCSVHSGMGGQINTNSTAGATVLSGSIRDASTVSSGNDFSAGYAGHNPVGTWSDTDSWSGLPAYSNGQKGYFSGTETLSNGSVISAAANPKPFGAVVNGSQGFVLRASATVTLRLLVQSHVTEIATTSSDSQTFGDRTIVATNPTSGTYVEATGKCFWWSGNTNYPSISVMGTLYDAPALPTISSINRANPEAGFSIVSFTPVDNSVIGHSLNAVPELIIYKNRDSSQYWRVYHKSLASGKTLYLNEPDDETTDTDRVTAVTSSTFTIGNIIDDEDHIAYCFAPVAGYSAFGSYTGSSSYPFIFTGFRPALIITKRTDANGGWVLWDTKRNPSNVATEELYPDDPSDEYTGGGIDILSNGFKLRNTSAHENNSGGSYIYIAFAEHPFKTARAR